MDEGATDAVSDAFISHADSNDPGWSNPASDDDNLSAYIPMIDAELNDKNTQIRQEY